MRKKGVLTHKIINTTSKGVRVKKLSDGKNLYLQIPPQGSRRWRFRYTFKKFEKMLSLGLYPDVSLKAARELALDARILLNKGIDPAEVRKEAIRAAFKEANEKIK